MRKWNHSNLFEFHYFSFLVKCPSIKLNVIIHHKRNIIITCTTNDDNNMKSYDDTLY